MNFGVEHLNCPLCLDRGDSVGDDVIWGRAICIRVASGSAGSAGEGRTSVTATHLHYRRVHGHGEMLVKTLVSLSLSLTYAHTYISGSRADYFSLHVEVSQHKIVNPELPMMQLKCKSVQEC